MALRMHHVALALADGGALLADLEAAANTTAIREYLLGLKGVGPTVIETYPPLRSSARI